MLVELKPNDGKKNVAYQIKDMQVVPTIGDHIYFEDTNYIVEKRQFVIVDQDNTHYVVLDVRTIG